VYLLNSYLVSKEEDFQTVDEVIILTSDFR